MFCRKFAPALLTGNTVVAKPSEVAPLTTIEAVRLIDEHLDLPHGVLNLVTGGGATGRALVRSELSSMVSFTGHRDTGKEIMATAAGNLTRVALELGGKAPAIVWKDADLDLAVSAITAARHTNCGQVCTSAERVLVHRDVLDEFSERYVSCRPRTHRGRSRRRRRPGPARQRDPARQDRGGGGARDRGGCRAC